MTTPSTPSIAQNFKPGDKLAGCYTLKEMLPPQGFCVLWLAHDEELNKDIALHFIPDSVAADGRAMSELKQEAKRNRQLIHPRIVRVHDLVEDEKWAAISMDHIQGDTVAALQAKQDKYAFNPSAIAPGVAELCQTLEDAHRIDLFHRDLTPDNILATGNGWMVQKFGLSRVILDSLARGSQAIENFRDIAFMSPQQLDGERASRADDIYSLGATIFDLLGGGPPFSEGDVVSQIRKNVPPLVSERRTAQGIAGEPVPKAWDETIASCLSKVPEERPKTAAAAGIRFTTGKPGAAGAVSAAAAEGESSDKKERSESKEAAAPEQSGKQSKRPWASGPGKTPVISEATVLSNTQVPKGEGAKESAAKSSEAGAEKKGGPTTPTGFPLRAFVEVEGNAKHGKGKSSAGMIAAGVVLLLILIIGYLVAKNNGGNNPPPENTTASNAAPAESPEAAASAAPAEAAPAEAASSVPAPVNAAANATPAPAEPAASAAPAVVAESTEIVASLAVLTDAQADKLVSDRTKAVDQARAALAEAEKAAKDKAAAQTQAAAAAQELQGSIKQKADAAAAAKKAADAAAATLKQQQDSLQKAEADAADAQKVAAAKTQAADQVRKTVQDAQAAAQQQQTAAQQAAADADKLAKELAGADQKDAAKAAADAENARQQKARALAQAQADLAQVQAGLQQAQQARNAEKARAAAEEAARLQKAREAETARLAAQAAAAEKAAADAQKALDNAKKAVADAEKAQQAAEQQAAAARSATVPMASPVPTPEATPTPPAGAAARPAAPSMSPSLTVHVPNPHLKVDQALSNSLGMRFAPVGNVFFSIWLTRVQDFETFAKATGYKGTAWRDPGFKQGADHPVVNVSWNDANQFCLWLTEKEHHDGILAVNETYRLPTDLEWSNAVGLPAETGRTAESRDMDVPDVYPWGPQWPPPAGAGNYTGEETDSDVAIKGYNDGFAWTSPVGSFNANKFGLYDMGGNVWEWCGDWWNSEQKSKVLRGGSWYNGALKLSLLSSCRIHASAEQGTDNYGFRVVIAEEMGKEKSQKRRAQQGMPSPATRGH